MSDRNGTWTSTKGEGWRQTFAAMTGMGLTDEQREERRTKSQCQRCEKYVDYLVQYSPIVRFMLDNISKVNGKMDKSNIKCLPCAKMEGGGFSPYYGVLLCQNRIIDRSHVEDTLTHELIHAYDYLRFKVDWNDMRHVACTEIRASSLSGECRWSREAFTRGFWDFTQQHQSCVRRRAAMSVAAHPKCKDDLEASKLVNQVFDSCFADTRPFEEIYR